MLLCISTVNDRMREACADDQGLESGAPLHRSKHMEATAQLLVPLWWMYRGACTGEPEPVPRKPPTRPDTNTYCVSLICVVRVLRPVLDPVIDRYKCENWQNKEAVAESNEQSGQGCGGIGDWPFL